ncbi:DNA polymerase III subunit gamma/tau, partial [Ruegeria sp.]|uniref:DNA polymerase III subunit gamma/tau n=1 Tax=Ruegeria sp. TaxID=1879320 RepID=UPI00230A4E41
DMIGLLRKIAGAESAQIADDALALITRAAEGSARDATSLLDQAISHGAGETSADQVRAMLGLADRGRVLDLMDMILRGDAAGALTELGGQYAEGADPLAVLRDLAEITHWVSVVKITPDAAEDPTVSPDERARGVQMAEALPMRVLTRMWQMLLKALEEVSAAPNAMMAAEMAVIRLTHVADLPSPEELIKRLQDTPPPPNGGPGGGVALPGRSAPAPQASAQPAYAAATGGNSGGPTAALAQDVQTALARYPTFDHVVELIRANRDGVLLEEVKSYLRLAAYQPGRIEFQPTERASPNLAQKLGTALQRWTGNRWAVTVVNEGGGETIYEKENAAEEALKQEASAHPLVQAVFAQFPKARITRIETPEQRAAKVETEALPEVEDEWDPFEED